MSIKSNPKYPIYIVSKGRWESRLTVKALQQMGVPFRIIVEKSEYKKYASVIDKDDILILPQKYLDEYDTCDDLGDSKSKGPGAARNYAWDHAMKANAEWHWVMDDNIDAFHRLNRNIKAEVYTGSIFKAAEDFVTRYENVPLAGFNYYSFCKSTDSVPPFYLNTRIYSCLFIKTSEPYYWRGRYNEDTDLSLRVLKVGQCTIEFNAFLCGKVTTQRMIGGNTEEFYKHEGTKAKSEMIVKLHPDVAKLVWKFNRWHHSVDYKSFRNNKLILKNGIKIPKGINNYEMVLQNV
jgi:hypothetical protein